MFIYNTALKLICSLVILLLYIRISGRAQLAPLSASDQIGNMVIGGLIGSSIMNPDVQAYQLAAIAAVWAAIQVLVRYCKYKSVRVTSLLEGPRVQLMEDGEMLPENFTKAKLLVMDFETHLHGQGITSIGQIENAWLEPDGHISVEKHNEKRQAVLLVANGSANEEGLEQIKQDKTWLAEKMKSAGYKQITDIFCAEWYEEKLWLYPEEGQKTTA